MSNDNTTPGGQPDSLAQALGFEEGDYVSIATNGAKTARTVAVDDLDADYAMGLLAQEDTWIGAQPVKSTTSGRAKASDVACIRVLYADFDTKDDTTGEAVQAAVDDLSEIVGAQPISVVDSGGGFHPRWKLEKPLAVEDAKGALNRWKLTVLRVAEENGFKADSVFDAPRLLRLPGTVNTKYGEPRPTKIAYNAEHATIPTSAVWSRLDHATGAKSPTAADPSTPAPETPAAPVEAPIRVDTLPERAVNSEVKRDLDRLARLQVTGWDGEPWHNTTRDVAYKLAKIAASPNTHWTVEEMAQQFFTHAPKDDDFDFDRHVEIWEGGLERADGEDYTLVGSGDEFFADDMDEMIAASVATRPKPDIDPSLSLDDLDSTVREPLAPAQERYDALALPLIPGFRGVSALRVLPVADDAPPSLINRLNIVGEDVSDFHEAEHDEYMHPHCPACFPETWRGQLNRWLIAHPRIDSTSLHPPIGRLAPGEGYVSGLDLLEIEDGDMLIDGFIPAEAVGVIRGRGGAGKTFVALDMAMSVLDPAISRWRLADAYPDEEFGGVNVTGSVMFLAGEGFQGLKWRVKSWLKHNGYEDEAPEWLGGLTVRSTVPDLFAGDLDFEIMLEEVRSQRPRLIVVDTLQKASSSADQNNASEMGIVHMRLAQLKSAADGGTVLVIAHTDKYDTSTRGSSSIEDDSDFVLHVKEDSHGREVEVTKMRDGESPEPLPFHLVPVGRSVVASATPEGSALKSPRMEQNRIEVLTALHELHSGYGDFDKEITLTDINTQVSGVEKADVVRTLALLRIDGHTLTSGDKKFTLTPKGRTWIEAKAGHLTALSRGFSS